MKKSWKPYAQHILSCIDKIYLIMEKGDITKDTILYDAILRNLQTMSEATRHLPTDKTKNFPEVPWKNISGFRNILVHDYLGEIDSKTVLDVLQKHIGPLQIAVTKMLEHS